MNIKSKNVMSYRLMMILTLTVGIIGVAFQFISDFSLLAFMLTMAVLGGLFIGTNSYEEENRQRLEQSYRKAFEGLLMVVLVAYALIELSKWFVGIAGVADFLNDHWPGLMLAAMCIVMGLAGLQKESTASSA